MDRYKPLKQKYSIEQIKSNSVDFFAVNTIVHQVKAWLRSVYSFMKEEHIEKYLSELALESIVQYISKLFFIS